MARFVCLNRKLTSVRYAQRTYVTYTAKYKNFRGNFEKLKQQYLHILLCMSNIFG